ncbi:hypothetical protein KR084_001489 [Drosophila pseudotakahashii]|nr:hypothetical protein KR084_001489 [Drosophila pseudotakahashii]
MENMDDLVNEYKLKTVVADVPETETNDSNSGGGSSGCYQEVAAEEEGPLPLPDPQFESIKQANLELLKEIDSLHSRTVETEKFYRSRNQELEKKMADKSMMGKPDIVQESIIQACQAAIDLLKDWPGDTVRLNFLATCLEPLLRNELVTSVQISELDLRLEDTLKSLVIQACSRRDDSARMLYEHILRQDIKDFKEKEKKLSRFHESLKQERQSLRMLSEDLRRRQDLIATLALTGLPPEDLVSPSHSRCELCQREVSTGPLHLTLRTRTCEKSESEEDLQKLSDAVSDLSVDKW